jgi:DNA-binding transcriptional LysR family regulator
MDRIDLFRIFVRVVDCSSFTRAADMLGMPRSTVSAAMQELEGRIGTRLVHRTTRRVAPTQDGSAFYDRCLRLLSDVEDVESLFRRGSRTLSGKLRLDVPARVGRLVIAPALPELLDRHPELEVELGSTDRVVDLIEDGVDCALRVGDLADSELAVRTVGLLPLINVASPAYLERHGAPETPSDLDRHMAVNYASPTTGRVADWEWVEAGEARSMRMKSRVTVNSAEAYIACCQAGLGLIQIPVYDVSGDVEAGSLVEVLPDYRAAPMPMALLYPHRRHLSRKLRIFGDWLEDAVRRATASPEARQSRRVS